MGKFWARLNPLEPPFHWSEDVAAQSLERAYHPQKLAILPRRSRRREQSVLGGKKLSELAFRSENMDSNAWYSMKWRLFLLSATPIGSNRVQRASFRGLPVRSRDERRECRWGIRVLGGALAGCLAEVFAGLGRTQIYRVCRPMRSRE